MSNKVLLKKSSVAGKIPSTSDLSYGELALNYQDGKIYYKSSLDTIKVLASSDVTAGDFGNISISAGNININGQYLFPSSDGTSGQVLATNGEGQLVFATLGSGGDVVIGGYNNSSLNGFPTGDYGDFTTIGVDAFGISLSPIFSCMDPIGSIQSIDLGILT